MPGRADHDDDGGGGGQLHGERAAGGTAIAGAAARAELTPLHPGRGRYGGDRARRREAQALQPQVRLPARRGDGGPGPRPGAPGAEAEPGGAPPWLWHFELSR